MTGCSLSCTHDNATHLAGLYSRVECSTRLPCLSTHCSRPTSTRPSVSVTWGARGGSHKRPAGNKQPARRTRSDCSSSACTACTAAGRSATAVIAFAAPAIDTTSRGHRHEERAAMALAAPQQVHLHLYPAPRRRGRAGVGVGPVARAATGSTDAAGDDAEDDEAGPTPTPSARPRWPLTALETAYLAWLGAPPLMLPGVLSTRLTQPCP